MLRRRIRAQINGTAGSWSPWRRMWFNVPAGFLGGSIVSARRGRYSGGSLKPGEIPMTVQMVLLPVFVLVGLTFALLLWMASARAGAVKGRQTSLKDIAHGQPNWP